MLCTFATLAVLAFNPGSLGAWLVVTILVVTEVGHEETLKHTIGRVGGTLVGVVIAGLLVGLVTSPGVAIVISLLLMMAALVIRFGPHYWLYLAFITPIEMLSAAGSTSAVSSTDLARAAYTLAGAALVLLASAIAILWARYREAGAAPSSPTAAPTTAGP